MTQNFLIVTSKQAILFPLKLKEVLPATIDFKEVEVRGKTVLACKHDYKNALMLSKAGYDIPAPLLHYYDPPKLKGLHDPMPHQLNGAAFHIMNPKSFNLSQARTGKTYTILLAFHYLKSIGVVKKLVVFTTLSTMKSAWCDSITETFHDLKVLSVHASTSDKRREILSQEADIYVINHNGVVILEKDLIAMNPEFVVWDECDNLTEARNDTYKAFAKVAKASEYLILASATPTSENKPTDAWALARLVNPDNVPKYFTKFREMTMRQQTMFKWVALPGADKIVHQVLQPSYCILKKDVIDLPELKIVRRECRLSEQQQKLFKDMRNKLAADIGDTKLLAVNGADALGKCLQLLLGVYKNEEGEYETIDCEPRLQEVIDCIEESPPNKKVLIFCMFKGALRYYAERLSERYEVVQVDGDVGKKQRDIMFKAFAAEGGPRVLLAIPKTCSHGLEFAKNCNKIIWLGPISSGKLFTQANERVASVLQDSNMELIYLGANRFEWTRYDQLEAKQDMQRNVLELCRTIVEDC